MIDSTNNLNKTTINEHSIQENIEKLFFQSGKNKNYQDILFYQDYFDIITYLIQTNTNNSNINYLTILYKLVANTRDIKQGKGLYSLTFTQICVWHHFFPELAFFMIDKIITIYGSWKDVKYLCNYVKNKYKDENHPIINYLIHFSNKQIKSDYNNFLSYNENVISLAAKWLPREKSNLFGWINDKLSDDYFKHKNFSQIKKTLKYRKILTVLNKEINPIEISLCSKNDKLNFYNYSIHNITHYFNKLSQIEYKNYFETYIKNNNDFKNPYSISPFQFGKLVISVNEMNVNDEYKKILIQFIDSLWNSFLSYYSSLSNIIPFLDLSIDMHLHSNDIIYSAISIALFIAFKSSLGKRILTTTNDKSIWINLDDTHNSFYASFNKIYKHINLDLFFNIKTSTQDLCNCLKNHKSNNHDIKNMSLILIGSNTMQYNSSSKFIDLEIKSIFTKNNFDYTPKLIFWNFHSGTSKIEKFNKPFTKFISSFQWNSLALLYDTKLNYTSNLSYSWSTFIKPLKHVKYDDIENEALIFFNKQIKNNCNL